MKTIQEILQQFLSQIGHGFSRYGEANFLPFQIEALILENIGPFKKFEANFDRNHLNVILGPKGSGKSIIIRSILLAFGRRQRYFVDEKVVGTGTIKLRIFPDYGSVTLRGIERDDVVSGYHCLVVDEAFVECHSPPHRCDNTFSELVSELHRRLNIQTVMTAHIPLVTKSLQ